MRFHGGDPTIGPRLRALLRAGGLEDVREQTVTNPMATVDDKLFLAQLVRNMRASILEAGAATDDEIDELEREPGAGRPRPGDRPLPDAHPPGVAAAAGLVELPAVRAVAGD